MVPRFLLAFLLFATDALPQGGRAGAPEFSASVEAPTVAVGTNFEVSFQLKNGEGNRFRPPTFPNGLRRLAGPSMQTSVSIVNGRYSQSMAWQFIVQAVRAGRFDIGPATVEVNGQTLHSEPVTVEVTASRGGNAAAPKVNALPPGAGVPGEGASGREDVFVLVEMSGTDLWPGRQVVANYVLYTRVGVESYDILQEPKFEGFYARELARFDTRTRYVTIKGRDFAARTLKSIALFPQQTGALTIQPMRFQFAVTLPGAARDPISRFFGQGVQPLAVETQALVLNVKALPEPTPPGFSGGVGKYACTVEADKTALSTDDALTLRLTIRGDGDGKRLASPGLPNLPPELEVFDPKIIEEETYENGEALVHARVLEYAILPKKPGEFDIRPELVVFDPDSARYIVKKAKPLRISVSQGTNPGRAALENPEVSGDLSPLRTSARWSARGSFLVFQPLFWLFLLLPALGLAGFWFWQKQRRRQAAAVSVSPVLQAKMQNDVARRHLAQAQKHASAGEARLFWDELSRAVGGWLSVKLGIVPEEMSRRTVREKLESRGIGEARILQVEAVLAACEMARFGGQADAGRMAEVLGQAEEVLGGF